MQGRLITLTLGGANDTVIQPMKCKAWSLGERGTNIAIGYLRAKVMPVLTESY